jgi:hypothetical protein
MISYTTISHMQGIAEALAVNELHLGTARLAATGERVAVVIELGHLERGVTAATPLALLKPGDEPLMQADGSLSAAAHRVFKTLKSRVLKADYETWFSQDPHGHVHVCFAKRGTPGDPHNALLTLPWADPDDLLEGTRVEAAMPEPRRGDGSSPEGPRVSG